jgi:alcohol dehydrogenase
MTYIYQTVSRTIYGHGAAGRLGAEVKRLGCGRAYLVMDRGILKNDVHRPVMEALAAAGTEVDIFSDVELDPSPASIKIAAAGLKDFRADIIIGIGGGSALDSAKALSLLAAHPGPLEQYFGMHLVPGPCMPTILVPTTAGTGSEMTSISVLADITTNSKKGIVSDHLYARTIVLDPDLTLSLPPLYTAYTGLDAFVHAMESYVNLSATPFTEGHTLQAMEMIARNLRKAYANGRNKEARARMLYGSAIAGMGFSNTQNGVIHALGMAVPAQYHLPHGLLMAAIAPIGIAFNCIAAPEKYAKVARILGCDAKGLDINEQAKNAVHGFTSLLQDVNVKPGLQPYGIKHEDLRGIAERAASSARLMDNNPRQGRADQLEALLEKYY